jgi:hypothetical protein
LFFNPTYFLVGDSAVIAEQRSTVSISYPFLYNLVADLGSKMSRSPSPRTLNEREVKRIARPGKMVSQGAISM